jgi:hypothetical protein
VPGGEVTYSIQLLNATDRILPDGVISHTLPAGFSYLPGSTRVTVGGWPIAQTDPIAAGRTLSWGPFRLPAAGHTGHNPYGVHTFVQDLCAPEFIDFQLDQALALAGSGGYVTQLFYRITSETDGPDPCAVYFVNAAYDRNLVPILRLQGAWNPAGFWEKPDPGPKGDYAPIAAAFARYAAGLPRRNTHPLYVAIWNEPDLWVEWSGAPDAAQYGRFFVAVADAIHRLGDPRIRVLNGAVTPANRAFIRQLLAVPGFVNAFDAWASHCYPYNHPPWYNIHHGTARYGNAAIDCYVEERDVIARYGGRSGFKFVLTETGHGLGDRIYAFERFPPIDEANRAGYISSAFRDYWRAWPEVIAVTPFELGDPWGGWKWLDWIDYRVSLDPLRFDYTPHPQYPAVVALPKPRGAPAPHGFEVAYRARLDPGLAPGVYSGRLAGSAGGAAASLDRAAEVRVVDRLWRTHFPVVANLRAGGIWYMGAASAGEPAPGGDDGAIRPTRFLAPVNRGDSPPLNPPRWGEVGRGESLARTLPYLWATQSWGAGGGDPRHIPLPAEPRLLLLGGAGTRAYVALEGGELAVVDLEALTVANRLSLGADAVALAPGPAGGLLYAALGTGELLRVDVNAARVTARSGPAGRPIDLAYDAGSGHLLVADAEGGRIVRWPADLPAPAGQQALDDLPGALLLDAAARRAYVLLPGARRVIVLHADTLRPAAGATLAGGPLIDMALDPARGRLYVLSALSPRYRGIAVLDAGDLAQLDLLAGGPGAPLVSAGALALDAGGHLLAAEGDRLYRVAPDGYAVVSVMGLNGRAERGGLAVDPAGRRLVWLAPDGIWVAPTKQ